MKTKRYNKDDVDFDFYHIPKSCAFCNQEPVGMLKIRKFLFTRKYWVCENHRHKWANGELTA